MLNPDWMNWSSVPLPDWARWGGVAVGLSVPALIYWIMISIGKNISETYLTKESHQLVRHGPYRWIRHPLYSVATLAFASLGLIAANWFMLAMALIAFAAIAVLVVPREEAELARKFGDEYRDYQRRTGRFIPRLSTGR
jgi:protein-S-isoprenylcysteine O-methyltransferase Ste14